jgi:hypothetical protein
MRGITLHRLDEIGNEIGASLQLGIDAAPRFGDHVLASHETIIGHHGPQSRNGDDDKNNQPAHDL